MPVIFKINVNIDVIVMSVALSFEVDFVFSVKAMDLILALNFFIGLPEDLKEANKKGIVLYIDKFLKSPDPSFVHVALWTLNMLLKGKKPFNLRMKQLFNTKYSIK